MFNICFTMFQVREISLHTDVPVVYCARIVLAVTNLNEIPCLLRNNLERGGGGGRLLWPGEETEEGGGGGGGVVGVGIS